MAASSTSSSRGEGSNRPRTSLSSADKLLLACCQAIKKEIGWGHRTLRQACDWATGELERNAHPGAGLKRYYRVMELALECRTEEVVEVALAQLQKLIAGGLVPRGMITTIKDGSEVELGETLVDVVLRAGYGDRTVRLGGRAQAVRCLLACIASPEIEVHGEKLRRSFRFAHETFLSIFSTAKGAKHNKAQTRAALGYILQITFSRLEKDTALATSVVKGQRQQPHQDQPQDEDATPTQRSTSPSHAKRERNASPVPKSHLSSNSSSPLHSKPHPPEATDGITLLDKQNEGGETGGSPQAGSQGLAEAVPPTVLEGVLPEVLEVLTSETPEVATNGRLGGEDGDGEVSDALTVVQADAMMLLAELSHWSIEEGDLFKDAPDRVVVTEELILESKTAALELIVSVLHNYGGPRFRTLPSAAIFVRGELCASLLHHCTSGVTGLVSLSLRVFVALVEAFKNHLKAEIEVFITSIFLRILESEHSVFDHKMLVLEVISELCRDPLALVEMFVNYDCDLQAIDLFKRIVTALAKVAKGRALPEGAGKKELEEERSLQLMGMGGTVDVVSSMVKAADLEILYGEMAMAPRQGSVTGEEISAALPIVAATMATSSLVVASTAPSTPRGQSLPIVTVGEFPTLAGTKSEETGEAAAAARATKFLPIKPLIMSSSEDSARGASTTVGFPATGGLVEEGWAPGTGNARGSVRVESQQAFDTKRRVQRELEAGIVKFNQNPKGGLAFLESKGHLSSKDPASIATFLREQADRLDKTQVGEYMGRGAEYMGGFCVRVLHAYVDGIDFTDMVFDEAIRHFLSGFRLPGEAQKIDRMMEKFAERFCLQNASVFPNPDTAFILAFSIVMLNTDLHNPSIAEAKRMTKEDFIRNNRGIDKGKSLPDEFLGGVYDRIAQAPISLKEDDQLRRAAEGASSGTSSLQELLPFAAYAQSERRRAAQAREREDMLKSSRALLTRQRAPSSSSSSYHSLHLPPGGGDGSGRGGGTGGDDGVAFPDMTEHVRLMFEITWGPMLAVFGEVLESCEDYELIDLCLNGFKKAVRIAGGLDVSVARETLMNALVRFTLLDSSRQMQDKHISCVKVLLSLALTDGNLLRESWGLVLRCISQLARLQLFASGVQPDEALLDGAMDEDDDSSYSGRRTVAESSSHSSGSQSTDLMKQHGRRTTLVPSPQASGTRLVGGGVVGGANKAGSGVGGSEKLPVVKNSSTDWLSDIKSALGVGEGTEHQEHHGEPVDTAALEQVKRYVKEREAYLNDRRRKEKEKAMGELASFFIGQSREEKERVVEEGNATVVMGQIDQALIDRVFSSTRLLNREAMQEFVEQLVQVSQAEIPQLFGRRNSGLGIYRNHEGISKGANGVNKPRVFSMQKLVEVADLNMNIRSRIEWARMWGVLADHFGTVGSMAGSTPVAMHTVDCLRQLALKFLDKDELRDFNFQRVFLGPFAAIVRNSPQVHIRELVVRCLNNIILAKGPLIRSGWKTVLMVLRSAARDREREVVEPASLIVDQLVGDTFLLVRHDFVDLVYTLLEMAACRFLDVSLTCIGHLRTCARELATGGVDVNLQRPLPEVTATNTGQVPPEAMEAVRLDHQDGESTEDEAGPQDGTRRSWSPLPDHPHPRLDLDPGGVGITKRCRRALQLWWPLLAGLSGGVGDPRLDCRSAALATLQDTLQEVGSAPEFSVRVWPFLLSRVLLPAARHAKTYSISPAPRQPSPRPPRPMPMTPPATPLVNRPLSSSTSVVGASTTGGSGSIHSDPGFAAGAPRAIPPGPSVMPPASRGVFALDVRSWVHTTAPQLFRAAAVIIACNAQVAAPLGIPTLMAFFEPYVCCRRRKRRRRAYSGPSPSLPPPSPRAVPALPTAAELRHSPENTGRRVEQGQQRTKDRRKSAADAPTPRLHGVAEGAMAGRGRVWEGDVESAADAGAAIAEECDSSGEPLLSRMALESMGLLVEGLAGQQIPREVLGSLCGSLLQMLSLCLPDSFGPAGRVHEFSPSPVDHGTTVDVISAVDEIVSSDESDGDSDSGWEDADEEEESMLQYPPMILESMGASRDDPSKGHDLDNVAEEIDTAEAGSRDERFGKVGAANLVVERKGAHIRRKSSRGRTRKDSLGSAACAGKGGYSQRRNSGNRRSSGEKIWPRIDAGAAKVEGSASTLASARSKEASFRRIPSQRTSITLLRAPEEVPWYDEGRLSLDNEGDEEFDAVRVGGRLAAALRLQRLLYGLARLHLHGLGEVQTRALLDGLSTSLRYARNFQMRHGLRMALFAAGHFVPRSSPTELPHLLEQEAEGLCYTFAICFRLLGVRWPGPAVSITATGAEGNGTSAIHSSAKEQSWTWSGLWPNPRAFDPETQAWTSRPSDITGQGGHQQRLRPPRPTASAREAGAVGAREVRGKTGAAAIKRNAFGTGGSSPAAVLVVDDLLEWRREGDAGPAGDRYTGQEAVKSEVNEGCNRMSGQTKLRSPPAGREGYSLWDGTAVAREYLCDEGTALLNRFFQADGEVQRGSLEDEMWELHGESLAPSPSPSSRTPRPTTPSLAGNARQWSSTTRGSSGFEEGNDSTGGEGAPPGRSLTSLWTQTASTLPQQQHQQSLFTPSSHPRIVRSGTRGIDIDLLATREAEVRYLTPAVLLLLRGLLLLEPQEVFSREARWVYPCVADLVVVRSLEVRAAVRELLSTRLWPLLSLPPEDEGASGTRHS